MIKYIKDKEHYDGTNAIFYDAVKYIPEIGDSAIGEYINERTDILNTSTKGNGSFNIENNNSHKENTIWHKLIIELTPKGGLIMYGGSKTEKVRPTTRKISSNNREIREYWFNSLKKAERFHERVVAADIDEILDIV